MSLKCKCNVVGNRFVKSFCSLIYSGGVFKKMCMPFWSVSKVLYFRSYSLIVTANCSGRVCIHTPRVYLAVEALSPSTARNTYLHVFFNQHNFCLSCALRAKRGLRVEWKSIGFVPPQGVSAYWYVARENIFHGTSVEHREVDVRANGAGPTVLTRPRATQNNSSTPANSINSIKQFGRGHILRCDSFLASSETRISTMALFFTTPFHFLFLKIKLDEVWIILNYKKITSHISWLLLYYMVALLKGLNKSALLIWRLAWQTNIEH